VGLIVALLAHGLAGELGSLARAALSRGDASFSGWALTDLHAPLSLLHEGASAAVRLAPHYSLAPHGLAEAWMELNCRKKHRWKWLIRTAAKDTTALSSAVACQIDAIDRSITREFAGAVDNIGRCSKTPDPDRAEALRRPGPHP